MSKVTRIAVRSGIGTTINTSAEVHRDNSINKWRLYYPSNASLDRLRRLTMTGSAEVSFINLMSTWISIWIEPTAGENHD